VTNNLDREFQRAEARPMRAGSLQVFDANGTGPQVKSLLRNILDISPCVSRFYGTQESPRIHKSLKINILRESEKNKQTPNRPDPAPKSLFHNILAISPCGSIFYADLAQPNSRKCLEIKILENRNKKNQGDGWPTQNQLNSSFATLQYRSIASASCFFSMNSPSVCAT
jgi:hypothetical protein